MTPRQKIDQLAESIADAAAQDGIALEEKVEALKALTGYLGIVQKGRGNQADDASADGVDFNAFRLAAGGKADEEVDDVGREVGSARKKLHVGRRERVRTIRGQHDA